MKLLIVTIGMLLTGCSTTTWDGQLVENYYILEITPTTGDSLTEVSMLCKGANGIGTTGDLIAKEINTQSLDLNSDNEIRFSRGSYFIGGTYHEFGPFKWGDTGGLDVQCKVKNKAGNETKFGLDEFIEYMAPKTFKHVIKI